MTTFFFLTNFISAVGVSRAINQFKANRTKELAKQQQREQHEQKQTKDKNEEKVKKLMKGKVSNKFMSLKNILKIRR